MYFTIKRTLCFFTFLSFSLTINSQNTTSLPDSLSSKSYIELSDLFYNSKPDTLKAIAYANAVYFKALKMKDTIEMLDGKYYLADIKNDESIYLNYCDSLIEITKKKPSKNFPAAIYINKAKFYFHKKENSNSLKELVNLNNYLSNNKNDSIKSLALIQLSSIKNSIGDNKEALLLQKKAYEYAYKKNYLKSDEFSTLPLNISLTYRNLNEIDSAYFYNNIAINLYEKINDTISLGYSFYTLGYIQDKMREYKKAVKSFKKAIPSITSDENYRTLTRVYTKIGILYDSINDLNSSLKYHLKADSLNVLKNISSSSLDKTYQFLYNYHKKNANLKEQLIYLNKLLELKDYSLNEKNKINKTFTEEYDIPNLLSEKKTIISQLENRVKKAQRNKFIYISLLIIGFILIMYQLRKKSVYKKRFLALVNQENLITKKPVIFRNATNTIAVKHNIPKDIVSLILKELEVFEKKESFLDTDNSLQSLARKFNTNSNYLSKIINQHKKTTFSNYINNLRINYIIEKLKTDSLLRKYTIKAIASEVGFKNTESFSKAFYKVTDIKPSYFIKELEKKNTKH